MLLKILIIALVLTLSMCIQNERVYQTTMTFQQAAELDTKKFTCDLSPDKFVLAIIELQKWLDVLSHSAELQEDIQTLANLKYLVQQSLQEEYTEETAWVGNPIQTLLSRVRKFDQTDDPIIRLQLAKQITDDINAISDEITRYLSQIEDTKYTQQDILNKLNEMYDRWKQCFGNGEDDKLIFPIIDLSDDNRRNDFNAWIKRRDQQGEDQQKLQALKKSFTKPEIQTIVEDIPNEQQIVVQQEAEQLVIENEIPSEEVPPQAKDEILEKPEEQVLNEEEEIKVQSEPIPEPITESITESIPEPIPIKIPETRPEPISQRRISESIPQSTSETIPEPIQDQEVSITEEKIPLVRELKEPVLQKPKLQAPIPETPLEQTKLRYEEPKYDQESQIVEPTGIKIMSINPQIPVEQQKEDQQVKISSLIPEPMIIKTLSIEPEPIRAHILSIEPIHHQVLVQQSSQQDECIVVLHDMDFEIGITEKTEPQVKHQQSVQKIKGLKPEVSKSLDERERLLNEREKQLKIREEQINQKEIASAPIRVDPILKSQSLKDGININDIDPTHYMGKQVQAKPQPVVKIPGITEFKQSTFDGDPALDQEFTEDLQDSSEYGYGMWLKYDSLKHEMDTDQYYFISRLTSNQDYEDLSRYGDRTLAIFMLGNAFVFATYDYDKQNRNIYKNTIEVDTNFDGLWYFIVFSYSKDFHTAIGFVRKYGNQDQQIARVDIACTHVPPFFLRIIVGGRNLHYDGFSGEIANFFINIGPNAFIASETQLMQAIEQYSNQPQSLFTQVKIDIVQDILTLDAINATQYQTTQSDDSNFILDEYAVSGWFRWVDDLDVPIPTPFRLFNIGSKPEGLSYGGTTMAAYFIGNSNKFLLTTYSLQGEGEAVISRSTEEIKLVWTFLYFGYSYNEISAYGALIQPGHFSKQNFDGIIHQLTQKLYFTIGGSKDEAQFNGKLAYISIFIGPQSYQNTLYFGEQFNYARGAINLYQQSHPIVKEDEEEGEPELVRSVAWNSTTSIYSTTLYHNDKNLKINGQGEYSFGTWARFLRSAPIFLDQRHRIHGIAYIIIDSPRDIELESNQKEEEDIQDNQIQQNEDEEDEIIFKSGLDDEIEIETTVVSEYSEQVIIDQSKIDSLDSTSFLQINREKTLTASLGFGQYQFSTYTSINPQDNPIQIIPYGEQLEGYWNYIYFGYKRDGYNGIAKAYVVFQDRIEEVQFNVYHELIIQSLRFTVGQDHLQVPMFNGYISRTVLSVGSGAFIQSKDALISYISNTLPVSAIVHPIQRKTLSLVDSMYEITLDQEQEMDEIQGEEEIQQSPSLQLRLQFMDSFDGATEYAISGWAKWSGSRNTGQIHNLIFMSQRPLAEIVSSQDSTLFIARNEVSYHFQTYTCFSEIDCRTTESTTNEINYGNEHSEYWDQWTFIYFGYSLQKQRTYSYIQYTFSQQQFELVNIKHFYLSTVSILLGQTLPGTQTNMIEQWQGYVKSWVLNVGEGSYRRGGWDQDENQKINFGLKAGSDHIRLSTAAQEAHRSDEVLDCNLEVITPPLHAEFHQGENVHIEGVTEYGYGYWMRFLYFSNISTIYVKPPWLGVSRLTTNKQFQDQESLGDRILVVFLGKGYYKFGTYNTQPQQNSVYANLQYPVDMEGEWIYLHFAYKRFNQNEGKAVGFILKGDNVTSVRLNVLHIPFQEYMQFLVGSVGPFYPNFNGQITHVRLNLGPGAYIDSKQGVITRTQQRDPKPVGVAYPQRTISIIKGKQIFNGVENNITDYKDYAGSKAYGISLWFRWNRTDNGEQQLIYRLTTTDPKKFSDSQRLGDRTLALTHIPRIAGVYFSSYTLLSADEVQPLIQWNCQIDQGSLESWIFAYFAYSREDKSLQYYLNAENKECKGNEHVLHLTPKKLWLYIGKDKYFQGFTGRIAYMDFEVGSYRKDNFISLQSYISGSTLFQSQKITVWEEQKDQVLNISKPIFYYFNTTEYFPLEGAQEYSLGLWCRFTSTLPQRLYIRNDMMQIARLSGRSFNNQSLIQPGDRVLSVFLSFQKYVFSTYDTKTGNNAVQTVINYGDELEGVWRYVYMAYSKSKTQITSFALDFKKKDDSKGTNILNDIIHKPLDDYATLIIGGEQGFNGIITKLSLRLGQYIDNICVIRELIESSFALPIDLTQQSYPNQHLQTTQLTSDEIEPASVQSKYALFDLENKSAGQYSISGWIKLIFTEEIVKLKQEEYQCKQQEQDQKIQQQVQNQQDQDENQEIDGNGIIIALQINQQDEEDQEPSLKEIEQINDQPEENDSQYEENNVQEQEGYQTQQEADIQTTESVVFTRKITESQAQANQDCQIIFRVTENMADHLQDRATQGDRTLYAEVCGYQRIRFSTYTLLGLQDANQAKYLDRRVELEEFAKSWLYFYMAYDEQSHKVSCVIKFPRRDTILTLDGILHFVPSNIGVFLGKDAFRPGLLGEMQRWIFQYGSGAFVQQSQGWQSTLPNYNAVQTDTKYIWNYPNTTLLSKTIEEQFTPDSVMEYGVGLWTRWMQDIPTKMLSRSPTHSVFRLSTTRNLGDQSQMGDRVLAVYIKESVYSFSTYDVLTNRPSLSVVIPYEKRLEGAWNFIYMAHKDNQTIGMILFRESQEVERANIESVHQVMSSFARIQFAPREFGYSPFHGVFYDPKVYFGPGSFQSTGQSMVNLIVLNHRHPPSSPVSAADFEWPIKLIDTSDPSEIQTNADNIHFKFEDKEDIGEYAFCGWIQPEIQSNSPNAQLDQVVVRLTTNEPEYQSDDATAGDRTILLLSNPYWQTYSTYSWNEPKHISLKKEIQIGNNRYQWVFVYFGYTRSKQSVYMYSLFTNREVSDFFKDVQHLIPRIFNLYLIKDNSYPSFYGKIKQIKLNFGIGAYTIKPKDLIDSWPYNPKEIIQQTNQTKSLDMEYEKQ